MTAIPSGFEVQPWAEAVGASLQRHPRRWIALANLESRLLAGEIARQPLAAPVWVCGLARAGTTIVLESLCRHGEAASPRYRDYPFVFLPWFWNTLLRLLPARTVPPAPRTHQDRILVTPDSPEAMEEPLWMAFFPRAHDPAHSQVMDAGTQHPEFEAFFRNHLRKLLLAARRGRYVGKGNYNLTRLGFLLRLFPDARFVLMVREPRAHVGSLIKQQRLMSAGLAGRDGARQHLRRVGHFEFGPDRAPINCGDAGAVRAIAACWAAGDEVGGWARCWAQVYGFASEALQADPALARATRVVRYEDLCSGAPAVLEGIFDHCALPQPAARLRDLARTLSLPGYYQPDFTPQQDDAIRSLTADVARRYGYG